MKTEPASESWQDIARETTAKLDAKNYIWMRHLNEIQAIVLDAIKKAHRQWMDGSPSLPPTTVDPVTGYRYDQEIPEPIYFMQQVPAETPTERGEIVRPQPDPRVEKALRDYDEGKALDSLEHLAACSVCGRKTWDEDELGRVCAVRQPSGIRCQGFMTETKMERDIQQAKERIGTLRENKGDRELAETPTERGSPDTLCRCDKLSGEHYESEHPPAETPTECDWPDVIGSGGDAPSEPHAQGNSEPEKWTRIGAVEAATKFVREWYGIPKDILIPDGCSNDVKGLFDKACDHFNAALAAERENIRQRAERMQQLISENVVIRKQLAAERKETEAWQQNGLNAIAGKEREIAKLEQQLQQALAAIADHNKQCLSLDRRDVFAACSFTIDTLDQSILDAHDKEQRKPLVDALEIIANAQPYDSAVSPRLIAADALAKVKQYERTDRN